MSASLYIVIVRGYQLGSLDSCDKLRNPAQSAATIGQESIVLPFSSIKTLKRTFAGFYLCLDSFLPIYHASLYNHCEFLTGSVARLVSPHLSCNLKPGGAEHV